jgi:hypothetical protein
MVTFMEHSLNNMIIEIENGLAVARLGKGIWSAWR